MHAGAAGNTARSLLQSAAISYLHHAQVVQLLCRTDAQKSGYHAAIYGPTGSSVLLCRDVNEAILDAAVMLEAPRASLNILCASR